MKIELFKYDLIFNFPAGTSRGVLKSKPAWFIQLKSANKKGIGEIPRLPGLSFDDTNDFERKLNHIIADINSGKALNRLMENTYKLPSIHFALETAIMDLNATKHIYFNNDFTDGKAGIPINGLIWMGDKTWMQSQIDKRLESGFRCLKMKIGALDIDTELDVITSIRKRYASKDLELRVDANGAFTPKNIMSVLNKLEKLKVHSIEQPIAAGQIDAMRKICANSPIPVCLDEELIGVFSKNEQIELLSYTAPQYIILKPGLLGGFSMCEQWIDLANKAQIKYWVTSSLESNIGLNAIAQWTSTLGINMPQGLGTGSLYTNNIPSPLYIQKDQLWFNPSDTFQTLF